MPPSPAPGVDLMAMEPAEVRRILERDIRRWQDVLGLHHWSIRWEVGRIDEGWCGFVTRDLGERKATIKVDPDRAKDEADLDDTIKHEMVHVLLGNFDIYRGYSRLNASGNSLEESRDDFMWHQACEASVAAVMRVIPSLPPVESKG